MVATLVPAAAASAAQVRLEYEAPIPHVEPAPAYTLAIEAVPGEQNHLVVTRDDVGYVVQAPSGAGLSAGERCQNGAPGEIRCPLTGETSHLSVFVDAGDGDDVVAFGALPGVELAEALGGPGNDRLIGQAGDDLFYGGSGDDVLTGGDGADRLDGETGSDVLDAGGGTDLVSYASRRAGVTVDLKSGNGGADGERDSLTGFEDVTGGLGRDRLYGDAAPNVIYGGRGGNDLGRGRGGNDTLSTRRSFGGAGDDVVDGKVAGCGGGDDLIARLRFHPPGPYGRACERVRSFFYNVTRPRRAGRKLRFRFTCPVRRCSGEFVLRDRRGPVGTVEYAALGANFGGKPSIPVEMPLERRPASPKPELVVHGQALARDSFRLRLR